MILINIEKGRRYAVVFVDVFDAQSLIAGKVDSVTKELMKVIKKELEKPH